LASEALAVCGIDTFYGDSHVLHDVSFALRPGRLLGLLGRNGAGKTTCMSTVMGFLKPRRGAIELQGENIAGLAPDAVARKGVCLVPQGRRMFRNLSVNENLMVAAQRHRDGARTGWSRDRVFALFPRLKERHSQLAGSLSGGEQQMLAIARALMGRPRLLLLDEPSLGLAPLVAQQIFGVIRELNARDRLTVFLVEQNAFHALKLAHRAYVMVNGVITLTGTGRELLERPEVRAAYLEGGKDAAPPAPH
jgi:branched-chain amino acid transport system ATP-binding protein